VSAAEFSPAVLELAALRAAHVALVDALDAAMVAAATLASVLGAAPYDTDGNGPTADAFAEVTQARSYLAGMRATREALAKAMRAHETRVTLAEGFRVTPSHAATMLADAKIAQAKCAARTCETCRVRVQGFRCHARNGVEHVLKTYARELAAAGVAC
jgi:hypothetical protein